MSDQQPKDKRHEQISATLGELKDAMQSIYMDEEYIRGEIENLRAEKKINGERIHAKLDRIQMSLSAMNALMSEITLPSVYKSYSLRHPEHIDIQPLEGCDELVQEILDLESDVQSQAEEFSKRLENVVGEHDHVQQLSDYLALLREIGESINAKRKRIEALKKRKHNSDKDSNEQRNATLILDKVNSTLKPLETLASVVVNWYFKKRKKIIAEVWKTSCALETLFPKDSSMFQNTIPSASFDSPVNSALKELGIINQRHVETHKANSLVRSGNMSTLERRKLLAGLGLH